MNPEFLIANDNPNPAEATPQQALTASLSGGSIRIRSSSGAGFSPVQAGFPATGWHQIDSSSDSATFQAKLHSGNAQLVFSKTSGNSWVLTSGQKNC